MNLAQVQTRLDECDKQIALRASQSELKINLEQSSKKTTKDVRDPLVLELSALQKRIDIHD